MGALKRSPENEMKTSKLLVAIAVLASLSLLIYFLLSIPRNSRHQIVKAIEAYRVSEGHLPDPHDSRVMGKLGFEWREGWWPEYKVHGEGYQILMVEGFDGPYWIYDSVSEGWTKGFP